MRCRPDILAACTLLTAELTAPKEPSRCRETVQKPRVLRGCGAAAS